ncbi:hypothetical protein [Streptomyces sp. NPDC127190]|uniref:hypothetical protein n=1 Tax=unclassified Streptomyces TaxID=2593676 RepID=UPI003625637B
MHGADHGVGEALVAAVAERRLAVLGESVEDAELVGGGQGGGGDVGREEIGDRSADPVRSTAPSTAAAPTPQASGTN